MSAVRHHRFPRRYRFVFRAKYLGLALLLIGVSTNTALTYIGLVVVTISVVVQCYFMMFGTEAGREERRTQKRARLSKGQRI